MLWLFSNVLLATARPERFFFKVRQAAGNDLFRYHVTNA